MMPSAPDANALSSSRKSIRPVQGNLTILTFVAYFMRLVPVRSAPAYVHQLQTNAIMRGSNAELLSLLIVIDAIHLLLVGCFEQGLHLGKHLLV